MAKTLVRRKRAAPPCGDPVVSGIYTLLTRQKERHAVKRVFLFGFRRPKAASTLRRLHMLGASELPLRNSPLRSEFTPHSRRGPEGPFCGSSSIYTLRTRHKSNHTVRCGYFYGILRYFKCSGQVNCPCAKVLPGAKRLYDAKAPPRRVGPRSCPASKRFPQDQKGGTQQSAPPFLHFDELPLQDGRR